LNARTKSGKVKIQYEENFGKCKSSQKGCAENIFPENLWAEGGEESQICIFKTKGTGTPRRKNVKISPQNFLLDELPENLAINENPIENVLDEKNWSRVKTSLEFLKEIFPEKFDADGLYKEYKEKVDIETKKKQEEMARILQEKKQNTEKKHKTLLYVERNAKIMERLMAEMEAEEAVEAQKEKSAIIIQKIVRGFSVENYEKSCAEPSCFTTKKECKDFLKEHKQMTAKDFKGKSLEELQALCAE